MHPDILFPALLLAFNIGLIFRIIAKRKHPVNPGLIESVKLIGNLGLGIGIYIQLFGLFSALNDLGTKAETLPLNIIAGGIATTFSPTLHGLEVYFFSLISYMIIKSSMRHERANE